MTVLHSNIVPIREDAMLPWVKVALSAGDDWNAQLRAAQVLAGSPDWKHQNLAKHIREAHSLHEAGLLKPVNPVHRDKSDMVDAWKALALDAPPTSRGTIRAELMGVAGFSVICVAVWLMLKTGGV